MKLIYGRAGVGKSEYIFKDIKNKLEQKENSRIYIITPEQFSFTAEKRLLDTINEGATTKVEVLSFERMAYRVIKEVIGNNINMIDKSGKAIIIYDAILQHKKELNFLGKSLENVEMIITQITEFKKHNITVNDLKERIEETDDKYLKAKLNDMLIMYSALEDKIENEFLDENNILTMLAENLKKSNLFENCIFYIDEFAGFTKQEYSVIKELNDIAKELYITVCTDELRITKVPEADIFYDNKNTVQTLCNICDIDKEKQIYLKENYRFKNAELKHLEKNIFDIPYTQYDKELENIKLYLADNQYSEVEYIATNIVKLVRDEGYNYKDIAVICNNIEVYAALCKAIFEEYEIPVFIDEKKDITQNILIKYLLSILDIFDKNWSYDSIFNYIKTGIVEIENIYELENYCLKWGIQGKKFYDKKWNFEKTTNKDENKNIDIDNINYNIEQEIIVTQLKELEKNLKENKTAEQISKILYSFMLKNLTEEIDEKTYLKEKYLSQENLDAFDLITNILNEIADIFKDRKITFEHYSKILKMGLSTKELGQIPEGQDKVTVGDVNRSKTHKVKAVFIIGVNDGIFPRTKTSEGFFNDKDRMQLKDNGLELAKGIKEKVYEENFNIYKAFSTAEEKLYVSYSSSNTDGEPLRKSLIISKLQRIFPLIKEDIIKDEILTEKITFSKLLNNLDNSEWHETYTWYENNLKEKLQSAMQGLKFTNEPCKINEENISKLYGNKLRTSVSRLESYMACPFSYYLKYGLNVSEKEKLDIKPLDTGTFMHDVIDRFFSYIKDEEELSVNSINDKQIEQIVNRIIEEKLSENIKFTLNAKYLVLVQRLKRVLNISIKYIIESLRDSDFEVLGTEVEFKEKDAKYTPIEMTLDDGKRVSITGKIDRIDIAKMPDGKYIRIIDYKSSTHDIDLNQVIAGLQLQLITYVDAVSKNENVEPAGALYFTLLEPRIANSNRGNISKEEIETLIKQNFKMDGLILANINVIKAMDKSLETGKSDKVPVVLKKDGDISYSKSSVVTKEEFEKLQKYTNDLIKKISNEILSGNIELKPFYNAKGKSTPCSRCSYKSVCQFNPKFKNNNYRFIPNRKKEDALKIINGFEQK